MSQLKRLLTTAPLLTYYDPAKKLTIHCDASSTGLGAALMQQGKPLAYASRALSDTEAGYAQIEKECLAIVFSLERFHKYTLVEKQQYSQTTRHLRQLSRSPCTKHRSESKACSFDCYSMTSKSPMDEARRCTLLMLYLEHISPTAMTDKDSSHRSTPSSICLSANQHCRNYVLQLTQTT